MFNGGITMKIKLYLDFDGVILDTINVTFRRIKELNITEEEEIQQFYRSVDWKKLLKETKEINNSLANIKKIIDSDLFDVEILTHVNSELEGELKTEYINEVFDGIKVNPVFKHIDKCDSVDPVGAILVDDYLPNLEGWYEKGGIPIKFSDNGKPCKYMSISSLDEVIPMYDDIKRKVKKKQVIR